MPTDTLGAGHTRHTSARTAMHACAFALAVSAWAPAMSQPQARAAVQVTERPPLCSSDGLPAPTAILERFIHANCESCWTATPPVPARGEVALDWIVPSPRGDEAPLSAVALREAQWRLDALGQPVILDTLVQRSVVRRPAAGQARLRVAHGLVLNGYVGASIELRGAPRSDGLQAWLLLVEQLPAGTEGSPVARQLVRNVLQLDWDGRRAGAARQLLERRPLSLPPGTRPDRVAVVGWVQDAQGRVIASARSRCPGPR